MTLKPKRIRGKYILKKMNNDGGGWGESKGFTTRYYEINRKKYRVQIQTQESIAIQYRIQMTLH